METLHKNLTGVLNSVAMAVNELRKITAPIMESTQNLKDIFDSADYENWKNELNESDDDPDDDQSYVEEKVVDINPPARAG